jgi:excisionase family DNA binding protein
VRAYVRAPHITALIPPGVSLRLTLVAEVKMENVLLTESQAAEFLQLARMTLANWRSQGRGPRFVRVGRLIRYRAQELETFLAAQTFRSTGAADAAKARRRAA